MAWNRIRCRLALLARANPRQPRLSYDDKAALSFPYSSVLQAQAPLVALVTLIAKYPTAAYVQTSP